jgi:NAD(P)-dependent dehydrogenase (short-subunit alcohol dehydrogenase family)
MQLEGKTAVVTGGASGIGLACGRALAAEGAIIALADLDEEAASHARRLVEEAVDRSGRLDVLVPSAGAFHATPFERITPDDWDGIQQVNLRGVFLVAQAALRVMIPQRWGRIVTIASLAGRGTIQILQDDKIATDKIITHSGSLGGIGDAISRVLNRDDDVLKTVIRP